MTSITEHDPWKITINQFDPSNQLYLESLTSTGNGYFGLRGFFAEGYSGQTAPKSFAAGIWYPYPTKVGWWKNGYPDYFGGIMSLPNFLDIDLIINGKKIDLATTKFSDFYWELDLKTGIVHREYRVKVGQAVIQLSFEHFASLETKELAVFRLNLSVEEGTARIKMASRIVDQEESWEHLPNSLENSLTVATPHNDFGVEQFAVSLAMENRINLEIESDKFESGQEVVENFSYLAVAGEKITLEKLVAIVTTRDFTLEQHQDELIDLLDEQTEKSYQDLVDEQVEAWSKRWEVMNVEVDDQKIQQGIHFNLFQFIANFDGEDYRLNISPKGFTGEKYGGATYWDTECLGIPFFLTLNADVSENLLQYRYFGLPQAQNNAKMLGLKGALYPMVTFTGSENHNEWEITFEEIHRNGAIAVAIYLYTKYTGKDEYLKTKGIRVLVELARFWASRVHFSSAKNQFMIHGVTGPNEYENNVNNNWYTNFLAKWTLNYTVKSYRRYQNEINLVLDTSELKLWEQISDNLYLPEDDHLGIFLQQDGFLDKEKVTVADLEKTELPINHNWSWDKILRSPLIKQADVLQGIYFFDDHFSLDQKRRNFEFYEPLTVHESSLSPAIHGIVAGRIGKIEQCVDFLCRSSRLDLDNLNHDTEDGLHISSMAGSRLIVVQGLARMEIANRELSFAPQKPQNWHNYWFQINFRDRLIAVDVGQTIKINLVSGFKLNLKIYDQEYLLDDKLEVELES